MKTNNLQRDVTIISEIHPHHYGSISEIKRMIIQSKIAIGSGGLTGKGFMAGTQSQLNFLPEKHNDFMLAVLLEETGLVGGIFIFSIFFYFIIIKHSSCFINPIKNWVV